MSSRAATPRAVKDRKALPVKIETLPQNVIFRNILSITGPALCRMRGSVVVTSDVEGI